MKLKMPNFGRIVDRLIGFDPERFRAARAVAKPQRKELTRNQIKARRRKGIPGY